MNYSTAQKLIEHQFPQQIPIYGTCPHVEDGVEDMNGECGCDIMYKIIPSPILNELVEKVAPALKSIEAKHNPDGSMQGWLVTDVKGNTVEARALDEALGRLWLSQIPPKS